jgi:hypothetical protein
MVSAKTQRLKTRYSERLARKEVRFSLCPAHGIEGPLRHLSISISATRIARNALWQRLEVTFNKRMLARHHAEGADR